MPHCVNIKHPEIKPLSEQFNLSPKATAAVIAVWQEKTGEMDRFPTVEEFTNELQPVEKVQPTQQPQVKEGVSEVFESSPELANQVYEALGFKNDVSFPIEKEVNNILSKINEEHNLGNIKDLNGEPIYNFEDTIIQNGLTNLTSNQWGHGATRTPYGKEGIERLENILSKKDEFTGDFGPIAGTELSKTNKYANTWESGRFIITRNDDNFYDKDGSLNLNGIEIILNRSFEPYSKYLAAKYPNVIFKDAFGNIIKPSNQITPQQKQQALEVYSQYLDTGKQDIEGFKEFVKDTGKLFQESGGLSIIPQSKIDNLQNTVENQLIVEQDDNLFIKGGQSYVYLNENDANRFSHILEKTKEFPKFFKVTKKITKHERIPNTLKYNSYNEYVDFYYIKLNNNKKSNLYQIVNKETGEIIADKVRVLHLSQDSKSKIAEQYGLEFKPTKVFSANRSIAFALYRQKPSKAKYVAQAKRYLYDAIKFLNPEETNLKINLDKIESFLDSFPNEMWDYINTTYSPEDSTRINASISLQNKIKFNLPKLGFLQEIEKITSIPLQGISFKNYDRTGGLAKVFKHSKLNGEWGQVITIDSSNMTTKELKASIKYYLKSKNYFKPSSTEENVRKYAEHNNIDYNELRELVFGDVDKALDNISHNTTGNSDTIEVSKWRESIREYNWQMVELFSKPYENFQNTVKERITEKFKDKELSNGISHLDYFFNSGAFNWLNINFNNISGTYYKSDMETETNVGVETKMGGIINPFEMKVYQKPKAGENFLQEKEVFNRLAAILHEPFHALHTLSYGTKEELDLRKAFNNLYKTAFGKEMMNQVFGSGYNKNQQVSYDTMYKEFIAFSTQLMLYPKQWINKTDLRSNDIAEFILKIQNLQDKTYTEIVKTQQKIGSVEKTITEKEQIKLSFLEKLYNYIVKTLQKIIPLSKKFLQILPESKIVSKQIIEDVFGTIEQEVVKTLILPENVKKHKEEFQQKMDELQSAINTLMQIDNNLFSSENIINFFTDNKFNQESKQDIEGFKEFVKKQSPTTRQIDTNAFRSMEVPNTNSRDLEIKMGLRDKQGKPVKHLTKAATVAFYNKALNKLNPGDYDYLRLGYNVVITPVVTSIRKGRDVVPLTMYWAKLESKYNINIDNVYGEFNTVEADKIKNDILGEYSTKESVQSIIDNIITSGLLSPEILELVELLRDVNVPVVFQKMEGNTLLSTDGTVIIVNTNKIAEAHHKLLAEGFVHELVHIKTIEALTNPQSQAEKFLAKRVGYLYNIFKSLDKENRYGGTDAVEFVAELLAKKEFREYVKSLEAKAGEARVKNIWQRIKQFIAEFLGIATTSDKLINELSSLLEKPVEITPFKSRSMEIDNKTSESIRKTKKVLEKIINSTGTRLRTIEHRKKALEGLSDKGKDEAKEKRQELIKEYEALLSKLNENYNNTKNVQDLEGVIHYVENTKELLSRVKEEVSKYRQRLDKGDYDYILKGAGNIKSMGNFAFAHKNLAEEILTNLDAMRKENPTMTTEIDAMEATVDNLLGAMTRLQKDYADFSVIVNAKFLLPFGMGRSVTQLYSVLTTSVKDISAASRWFDNMQESGDEALAMIDVALKTFYGEAMLETIALQDDLLESKKALEKKGIKDTKFMVKKHNGKKSHYFVTERNIVAFREKASAFAETLTDPDKTNNPERQRNENKGKWVTFFRANSVNSTHNKEAFDKLTKETEAKFVKKYGKERGLKLYKVWFAANSVYNPTDNHWTIPNDIDSQYKELGSNQDKLDFYWKTLEYKYDLEKHLPDSKRHLRRLPQIRKDFVERIKDGSWDRMWEMVKEDFQIKEDETEYGSKFGLTDEAGNLIQFLPIYFVEKTPNVEDLSEDIVSSMIAYGYHNIKREKLSTIVDILEMGKDVIKERGVVKTSGKGQIIKAIKKFTGQKVEEPLVSKDSYIYDRLEDYINMFVYGKVKAEGATIAGINIEKTLDMIGRYTGLRVLAGNVYAMLANINIGTAITAMEATNKQFFNTRAWGNAEKTYWSNITGVIGDVGQRLPSSKLSLWGKTMDPMNNYDEQVYGVNAERKTVVSQLFGSSALFFTSRIPEHYLHNRVSLAIADTFRFNPKTKQFVWENNFFQELHDLKNKKAVELKRIRKEMDTTVAELNKKGVSKEDIAAKKKEYFSKMDVITEKYNSPAFKDSVKQLEERLKNEWKAMTNYWDAFEAKDRKLVLKPEFNNSTSKAQQLEFINRQHAVNNTIQGMYSKLDKNAIQQFALGRLAMMFRKWMKPAWNRRFSKEHTNFESQLEMEGYYRTFGRFAWELIKDLKSGTYSIAKNWATLTATEKSAVHRVFKDMAFMAAIYILAQALINATGDDDDDWTLNLLAYQARRLATEYGAFTPPFMVREVFTVMDSPMAAVNTTQQLYSMFTSLNWFETIERGKYKDMYIWQRNLIRTIPMLETGYSLAYPEEKLKFFTMQR